MPAEDPTTEHDLLLRGARVIDPETGLDAVRNVALTGGTITAVTTEDVPARKVVELAGRVLAPGFIDLHSHAQTSTSLRVQALDGVTTALELEAGDAVPKSTYQIAEDAGRPINFGYSASWAMARMRVLDGAAPQGGFLGFADHCGGPRWRDKATPRELDLILADVESQLNEGTLGIGVLLGYAPASGRKEYFRLAQLAAKYDAPTFTHARFKNPDDPETALEGISEVVATAMGTGAHMHVCHVNSTSLRAIDEVAEVAEGARAAGLKFSTEGYPYGAGMTTISAPFLHPDKLPRVGITPSDMVVLHSGERPRDAKRLLELQLTEPGAMVAIHYLNESDPDDWSVLQKALVLPDSAVASDAIAYIDESGGLIQDEWPLPPNAVSHPRTAGTFSRFIRLMARELDLLPLTDAIGRCTLRPAQILQSIAPQFAKKGRVQVGADADLVVFDLDTISDRATYSDPAQVSAGVDQLLVNGEFVIRDRVLLPDALPGRAMKGRLA